LTEHRERVLRIERTFDAPIEEVFDAWTSEAVLRRWLHCGPDWQTPVAEVDLRVGGRIRIVMRDAAGADHGATGEYRLIDRPHRLVFTWTFDEHPDNRQLIELLFSARGRATDVVMINSGIATDGRWQSQKTGWEGCYEVLEGALGRG
jgi:uncharacterized protein YndB with AHSA1/START domain